MNLGDIIYYICQEKTTGSGPYEIGLAIVKCATIDEIRSTETLSISPGRLSLHEFIRITFVLNVYGSVSHESEKLNQDFNGLALTEFTEITKIIDSYLIF